MGSNDNLSLILATVLISEIFFAFILITLGPVIDCFLSFSTQLPIVNLALKSSMVDIVWIGNSIYWFIIFLMVFFAIWPVIYVIKRHRYMDVEPVQDEQLAYNS